MGRFVAFGFSQRRLLLEATNSAGEALNAILQYDGGFLNLLSIEITDDDDDSIRRQEEVTALRTEILPFVVILLHSVYDGVGRFLAVGRGGVTADNQAASEWFKKCLELSVLVAKPEYGILQCVGKKELRDIVRIIGESGVELLRCEQVSSS